MTSLSAKYRRLKEILESCGSLLVAYSGGVDSTLLLKVASDVLGRNVLAVTADSATYPRSERIIAKRTARRLGVRHLTISSGELDDPRFARNTPDRCYWCKRRLLERLSAEAARRGIAHVAVAAQADDERDYRPGAKAVRETGTLAPLVEAGFSKRDVRRLSRRLCLAGWRRGAMACLASRIPYGETIDRSKLRRVERAEEFLVRKGFTQVRVRSAGDTARIEVDPAGVARLCRPALRREVVKALKGFGFLYVTADMEGYRMGSLNEAIAGARGRSSRGRRRR